MRLGTDQRSVFSQAFGATGSTLCTSLNHPPLPRRSSDAFPPLTNNVIFQRESWRRQLIELGSHLASLVQLLKIGLEDARDVFKDGNVQKALCPSIDGGGSGSGGGSRSGDGNWAVGQGTRMLDVQADAMRLDADVQSDFVMFIQAFMDRWATVPFTKEAPT